MLEQHHGAIRLLLGAHDQDGTALRLEHELEARPCSAGPGLIEDFLRCSQHPFRIRISRSKGRVRPVGVCIWAIEFFDEPRGKIDRLLRTTHDQTVGPIVCFHPHLRGEIHHAPAPANPLHQDSRVTPLLIFEEFLHDRRNLRRFGVSEFEGPSVHGIGRRACVKWFDEQFDLFDLLWDADQQQGVGAGRGDDLDRHQISGRRARHVWKRLLQSSRDHGGVCEHQRMHPDRRITDDRSGGVERSDQFLSHRHDNVWSRDNERVGFSIGGDGEQSFNLPVAPRRRLDESRHEDFAEHRRERIGPRLREPEHPEARRRYDGAGLK